MSIKGHVPKQPALSLFSGAGGMDIGVDRAGFKTICSIELDVHCAATLRRNTRRKAVWQVDARALDPNRLLDSLGLKPGGLTLLHGGPPSQRLGGLGKNGNPKNPRRALIFEMVRFTQALRPTAVLIEQVPNFLRTRMGTGAWLVEALHEEFYRLGYELYPDVLDAGHFGVAQNRKRGVIVCLPRGQSFEFRRSGAVPTPTVGDALRGLPAPAASGDEPDVPNHIDVTPPRDRERIAHVPEGHWLGAVPDIPADIQQSLTRKDSTKFRRLNRSLPAPTLRGGEAPYHPTEDRYITPREAARLQGFPDKYIFSGPIRRRSGTVPDLDQHRQVANAVPPPLARSVAKDIAACLRGLPSR